MEEYIAKLVLVFREVRRVLRSDGVCWIEIGDSYAGSGIDAAHHANPGLSKAAAVGGDLPTPIPARLKPLDLANVPFRLALALQADGWYHRSTLIWSRPNPMPESQHGTAWMRHRVKVVTSAHGDGAHAESFGDSPQGQRDGREFASHDSEWWSCPGCPKCTPNDGWVLRHGAWRPTDQHSYILMLTKTANYFCDQEAVKEPHIAESLARYKRAGAFVKGRQTVDYAPYAMQHNPSGNAGGRNMRTVLTIPTEPTSFAHFATFPQSLVEPLILASTALKGCCPACGKQWARMVEHSVPPEELRNRGDDTKMSYHTQQVGGGQVIQDWYNEHPTQTLGWKATCEHGDLAPVPSTVLDCFAGSGTTCIVARRYGRKSIGIDLSADYLGIAVKRLLEAHKAQRKMAW